MDTLFPKPPSGPKKIKTNLCNTQKKLCSKTDDPVQRPSAFLFPSLKVPAADVRSQTCQSSSRGIRESEKIFKSRNTMISGDTALDPRPPFCHRNRIIKLGLSESPHMLTQLRLPSNSEILSAMCATPHQRVPSSARKSAATRVRYLTLEMSSGRRKVWGGGRQSLPFGGEDRHS